MPNKNLKVKRKMSVKGAIKKTRSFMLDGNYFLLYFYYLFNIDFFKLLFTAEERRIQVAETLAASNLLAQRSPSPDNNLVMPIKREHHRPRLHSRFK